MACTNPTDYVDFLGTFQQEVYVEYNNGVIRKFSRLFKSIDPSAQHSDFVNSVNDWYLRIAGRPVDFYELSFWYIQRFKEAKPIADIEKVMLAEFNAEEGGDGGVKQIYTYCEFFESTARPVGGSDIGITTQDIVDTPVSASQMNSKLLGRPSRSQVKLGADFSKKNYLRWNDDGSTEVVITPEFGKLSNLGNFANLSKFYLPYPTPEISVVTQPDDKGSVFAGTNSVQFDAAFKVLWQEDDWPKIRERGANDVVQKTVTVTAQEKRGNGAWQAIRSYQVDASDSQRTNQVNISVNTTTGVDLNSAGSSLEVQVRFLIEAELRIVETLDATGATLPEEKYTGKIFTQPGALRITVFDADGETPTVTMRTMLETYESAIRYERSIDNTTAILRTQEYQFNASRQNPLIPPNDPNLRNILSGFTVSDFSAPGRNPRVSVDWEWQVRSRTNLNLGWGSLDRLSASDGTFPTKYSSTLVVSPLNNKWQSYEFRLAARSILTLDNPSETITGDWAYTNAKELTINYQVKDPEYVLPNNIRVSAGFTKTIDFYTRWTGSGLKTYYWRLEDVTTGNEASSSEWNTTTGSFTNRENLLQTPNDLTFNKSEIELDPKEVFIDKDYRLSVYKNSNFTGLVARKTVKLEYVLPKLELTGATVTSGAQTFDYDKEGIQDLKVQEGDTIAYTGLATDYGIGKTLYWSYEVLTDPDDPSDVEDEINGYAPDTYYAVTTTNVPGSSNTNEALFALPSLTTANDSGALSAADRGERIDIKIFDDAYTLKDAVRLNNNDKLDEVFAFTSQPVDSALSCRIVNDNPAYVIQTGSGVIKFPLGSGKPYSLQSPTGTQSVYKEGWQVYTNGSWIETANYYGAEKTDVLGNKYTSTRIISNYNITWTDWVNKSEQQKYRYFVTVQDSATNTYTTYVSNVATMTFNRSSESYAKGILAGNLVKSYEEGTGAIKLWVKTWDSLGMRVEFFLSNNDLRATRITGTSVEARSTVVESGAFNIPSTGPRLREDTITLPNVNQSTNYAVSRFTPFAYWVPDTEETVTLVGSDGSTAQGTYTVTNNNIFDPNDFGLSDISVSVSGLPRTAVSSSKISISESFNGNWDVTVLGRNIPPSWQTAGKWIVGIQGEAAKHWEDSLPLKDADFNAIPAETLPDFVFNNDASTAQKRFDGRYSAKVTLPPPSVLPDESKDFTGKLVICYQTNVPAGTTNRVVWSKDLVVTNSIPATWQRDAAENSNQLYVVASDYSVTEGDSVTVRVVDKVKSDNTEFDSWNDSPPIPAGTTLYFKVIARNGGDSSDYTTSPAISGGYGSITMNSNGIADPITITFTDDSDIEETEQFQIRVSTEASKLDTAGSFAVSGYIDVADNDTNPADMSSIPSDIDTNFNYGNCPTAPGDENKKAQAKLIINSDGTVQQAVTDSTGILPTPTTLGTWLPAGTSASDFTCEFQFIEATSTNLNTTTVLSYTTGTAFDQEVECTSSPSIGLEAPRCALVQDARIYFVVILKNKNDGGRVTLKNCAITVSQEP